MFKRHNDGHPLGDGHTIDDGKGMVYIVKAPTIAEAILLKASKTLEPTRLYGISGYDLLLIVPVGSRSESENADKQATRLEALTLAAGLEINGFKAKQEGARPLEMCAWCHKNTTDAGKPLLKCSSCKNEFYCSPEHQKLNCKKHKVFCRRSKDESWKIAMDLEPFVGKKE
jgi:hypothetical protein